MLTRMILDEAILSMHEHQTNCKVPKNAWVLTQGDNTYTRTCSRFNDKQETVHDDGTGRGL